MKTALQWLDERGFHYKDKGVWESDIEAIQKDARAELLTERDELKKRLEVARKLLERNADGWVEGLSLWQIDVAEFLSTFKNHEA